MSLAVKSLGQVSSRGLTKIMKQRPFVFVGSSVEGLEIAKAIQSNLDFSCESQIWSQGLFGLNEGTLTTLVDSLERFDFAILVLTSDDLTLSRGTEQRSPRDNVVFELGLFIGGLGKDRVFMVVDRSARIKLPSDLAGITPATFERPIAGTMQSAVGAACTAIDSRIKELGPRHPNRITAHWWTGCLEDALTENPDFFMTVLNHSSDEVPWPNVHVFPSNDFQLEPTIAKTERLMAGQYATYCFKMMDSDRKLSKWAKVFAEKRREELSIRIFKDRSVDDALLISFEMGAELFDRIQKFKLSVGST